MCNLSVLIGYFVSSINKQLGSPHKDPPCLKIIGEKVEVKRNYFSYSGPLRFLKLVEKT